MKPTCPDCGAALSLPTLTDKQLGSLDADSLQFNCPKCEKQLSVKDFMKDSVAGMVTGLLPFGKDADGNENLLDELDLTGVESTSNDENGLDDLDLGELDLGDSVDLGDSLDVELDIDDSLSEAADKLGTPDLQTPELGIANIVDDGDDAPELSVVSDTVDIDDFEADELPSLDDDDEILEFASDELDLADETPLAAEEVQSNEPADSVSEAAASDGDAGEGDDDIDWLSDELVDDDTDLEFDDTLVDSGDITPDMQVADVASSDVDDAEFDFDLSDAEDATDDAAGHLAGATMAGEEVVEEFNVMADETVAAVTEGADEFVPADAGDHVEAAGIFEMRDPPLAASLAEPVAPDGTGHATDEPTAPFGFEQAPQPGSFTTAPLPPKRGGLIGKIAKLGIVGLLLAAIAQGAAWWGLGLDPANLAHKVPKFLVPKHMRKQVVSFPERRPSTDMGSADEGSGSADGSATANADAVDGNAGSGTTTPFDAGSGTNDLAGGTDNAGSGTASDAGSGTTGDGSETNSANSGGIASAESNDGSDMKTTTTAPTDAAPLFDNGGLDDLAGDREEDPAEPTSDDDLADMLGASDPPVVDVPSPFEGANPTGFATYGTQDLAGAIPIARKALQRFEQARLTDPPDHASPETLAAAKEFYFAINDVAEQATLVPHAESTEILSTSRDLLRRLNDDQQGRCSAWADQWISKDLGKGVVFAADVLGISKSGELYELALTIPNKQRTQVTAVTRMNPADNPVMTFEKGTRVLLMGLIVNDPGSNLPGYSGLESKVIYFTDQIVEGK